MASVPPPPQGTTPRRRLPLGVLALAIGVTALLAGGALVAVQRSGSSAAAGTPFPDLTAAGRPRATPRATASGTPRPTSTTFSTTTFGTAGGGGTAGTGSGGGGFPTASPSPSPTPSPDLSTETATTATSFEVTDTTTSSTTTSSPTTTTLTPTPPAATTTTTRPDPFVERYEWRNETDPATRQDNFQQLPVLQWSVPSEFSVQILDPQNRVLTTDTAGAIPVCPGRVVITPTGPRCSTGVREPATFTYTLRVFDRQQEVATRQLRVLVLPE